MRVFHLAPVVLLALLVGCSSAPKQSAPSVSTYAPSVRTLPPVNQDVVFRAIGLVGTPYRYGGSSPETGFDCSGLINYVYREAVGVSLPRTTAGLYALESKNPPVTSLVPGDLVLFAMNGGSRVNHAGIYVGDGRFLHAPSTGGRVRMDSLQASFWQRTYTGARRVLQ